MRKYITMIALLLISTVANAAPTDDALSVRPPKARSADQIECLKQNADNHAGYLACIRAKKGLKADDDSTSKSATNPAPFETNSNSGIR